MAQFFRSVPRGTRIGILLVVIFALIAGGALFVRQTIFGGSTGQTHQPLGLATLEPASHGVIYTLDDSSTTASFTIHEVLFGNPNTVVGKTNKVSGQARVDQQNPALSKVGEIRIDVSTLVTDNDLRNNIIRNQILETNQPGNQYATFVPTALKGLPTTKIAYGQQLTFQIIGNLTIHGATHPATFDAQATLASGSLLTGTAQTTIAYADYGISVPDVPSVTGIDKTVVLALAFTGRP